MNIDIEKFKTNFHKNFMKTLTSNQYKIPADTKSEAFLKWIEVSVIFDSTVKEIEGKIKKK